MNTMNLKRIILASRPIMWLWTILMYLVGIGSFSNLSLLSAVEIILFTFPLNFFIYGFNDIYDAKSDRINDRKEGAQGIVAEDKEIDFLKKFIWIPPLLFFIVTLFSKNLEHILLSLVFTILVLTYSHKITRFKEIPILDCFTSGAIYCIPGLIAYSLHASIFTMPISLFFIILPYMGVHAVTTLMDDKVDALAGMTTIGVVFKKTGTILFSMLMFSIALILFRTNIFLVSVFFVSILLQVIFLFADRKSDAYFRFSIAATLVSFGMVSLTYHILVANS